MPKFQCTSGSYEKRFLYGSCKWFLYNSFVFAEMILSVLHDENLFCDEVLSTQYNIF